MPVEKAVLSNRAVELQALFCASLIQTGLRSDPGKVRSDPAFRHGVSAAPAVLVLLRVEAGHPPS